MKTIEKTTPENELQLINNSLEIYSVGGSYINHQRLFHAYFGQIANIKTIPAIEITAMREWILSEMRNEIQLEHYNQTY